MAARRTQYTTRRFSSIDLGNGKVYTPIKNEFRAMAYYTQVAQQTSDAEVRRLATEFAAEETEHVEAIEDWLARTPRPSATMADDPDRSA